MDATARIKYPRTRHLPSSRSATDDDKIATPGEVEFAFGGQEVVITEKMDGENSTIYSDGHSHARSVDSRFHESRSMVRQLAGEIAHDLPEGMRICGENLYARHSIGYSGLPTYFQVYNIWEGVRCLSWDETLEWCGLLGLTPVPTLYRGEWQGEEAAYALWESFKATLPEGQESEGFVVRRVESFTAEEFSLRVMKLVRHHHVQTTTHWMSQELVPNELSS